MKKNLYAKMVQFYEAEARTEFKQTALDYWWNGFNVKFNYTMMDFKFKGDYYSVGVDGLTSAVDVGCVSLPIPPFNNNTSPQTVIGKSVFEAAL